MVGTREVHAARREERRGKSAKHKNVYKHGDFAGPSDISALTNLHHYHSSIRARQAPTQRFSSLLFSFRSLLQVQNLCSLASKFDPWFLFLIVGKCPHVLLLACDSYSPEVHILRIMVRLLLISIWVIGVCRIESLLVRLLVFSLRWFDVTRVLKTFYDS